MTLKLNNFCLLSYLCKITVVTERKLQVFLSQFMFLFPSQSRNIYQALQAKVI